MNQATTRTAPPTSRAPPTKAGEGPPTESMDRIRLVGLVLCLLAIVWIVQGVLVALRDIPNPPPFFFRGSALLDQLAVARGPALSLLGLLVLPGALLLRRGRRLALTWLVLWAWLQMAFAVFFAAATWPRYVDTLMQMSQAATAAGFLPGPTRLVLLMSLPLPFLWLAVWPIAVLFYLSRRNVNATIRSWR